MHIAKPFTYPRQENRARHARRKPRKRRGLLRRALGVLWRHPLLAGAALAATGWLLSAPRPERPARTRRVGDQAIPTTDLPAEGAPSHG